MDEFAKHVANEIEDLIIRCLQCHVNSSEGNLTKTNAVLNLCLKDNRPETFYHVLSRFSHCYPSYNFILSERND